MIAARAILIATLGLIHASTLAQETPADREFTFAVRLLQRGEHDLARDAFDQFLNSFPDDKRADDAHYYLALLARQEGKLDLAERHLTSARKPVHIPQPALRMLHGQILLQRGNQTEALQQLESIDPKSLRNDESRAVFLHLLGTAYSAAGNASAAAERFAEAAQLDTSMRAKAWLELGKTRLTLHQPQQADVAFERAIASNPTGNTRAEVWLFAAEAAYRQGQYEPAAQRYQQVIDHHQTSPYFTRALLGVLRAQFAAGRYERVLQRYENTKTLLPEESEAEALYLTGVSLVQLERYESAAEKFLAFYQRTEGDHPLASEVAYYYALCFYHTDLPKFEAFVASFEKELPKMARGEELQFLRAQAAITRKNPIDAIRHLTPVIEWSNGRHARDALRQRAALNEQLGREVQAADDYARFAEQFPADAFTRDASRRAIDLYFRAGQFERTVSLAQAFLERTEIPQVRLKLALALMKLDRNRESLNHLHQLIDTAPALSAQACYWIGVQTEEDEEAIEWLGRATAGDLPDEQKVSAFGMMAQRHIERGEMTGALNIYDVEIRKLRSPDQLDPELAVWIGAGLRKHAQFESALHWLEPTLARDDLSKEIRADALYQAGESQLGLNRFEQAESTFRKLMELSKPYEPRARLGLADSLSNQDRWTEALREYDRLINAEQSEVAAKALMKSAVILFQLERSEAGAQEARRRLNRIIILHDVPELADVVDVALFTLGRNDDMAGNRESARKQFQAILARKSNPLMQMAAKAEMMILDGNLGGAAATLRELQANLPEHAALRSYIDGYTEQRLTDIGEKP